MKGMYIFKNPNKYPEIIDGLLYDIVSWVGVSWFSVIPTIVNFDKNKAIVLTGNWKEELIPVVKAKEDPMEGIFRSIDEIKNMLDGALEKIKSSKVYYDGDIRYTIQKEIYINGQWKREN